VVKTCVHRSVFFAGIEYEVNPTAGLRMKAESIFFRQNLSFIYDIFLLLQFEMNGKSVRGA
jgi:hypothetical protein